MIVLSHSLALSLSAATGENGNNPIIAWNSLVTVSNIVATSEDPNYPASNLSAPQTISLWKSLITTDQYLTVNVSDLIDSVAIARHNLGSSQAQVSVEITTADVPDWTAVVGPVILGDDAPVIFRFDPTEVLGVRLLIQSPVVEPWAAVMYVGKLLVLPRRIYVGHTPIPFGRDPDVVNGLSQRGEFLGRIVTGGVLSSAFSMQNILPSWYRGTMDPFIEACATTPFFFSWRPEDWPTEVGFCWCTNNPRPVNQRSNGMMSIGIEMQGLAL